MTTEPAVVESPAEEPARFFELDPDAWTEVICPDCGGAIYASDLVHKDDMGNTLVIGALTLGDLIDAANEHVCAEEE